MVDAEAAQAVVQLGDQPAARAALVVALVAHRHARLRGQHDVVAAAGDGLADHLFRLAVAVHVGGVDEVDPGFEGGVDDGGGLVLGGASDRAEVHRAEREGADLHTGAAQGAVLHDVFLLSRVERAAQARDLVAGRPLWHHEQTEPCSACNDTEHCSV